MRPGQLIGRLLIATLLSVVAFAPFATPSVGAATITVSNLADSGAGSLRAAIAEATGGDTITFQEGLSGTIPLASELAIGKTISIVGPPLVSGIPAITLDGQNSVRVLQLGSTETGPITIEISNLAISRGLAVGSSFGGGIRQGSAQVTSVLNDCVISDSVAAANGSGGGVQLTGGSMTINRCRLTGNRVPTANGAGGAINNVSTLTINDSTISGNSAVGFGGGISNSGVLTINRSTLSGNVTNTQGGALVNGGGEAAVNTAILNNCTISGNATVGASAFVSAIKNFADSGKTATVTLTNCTIANNTTEALGNTASIDNSTSGGTATISYRNTIISTNNGRRNVFNGPGANLLSNGYNLCSDNTCNLTATGDRPNTPVELSGNLASRGGLTETLLPLPGSVAIDGGAAAQGITTDQRGLPRPADLDGPANAAGGDGSDIGAVEVQPPTITAAGPVTVQPGGSTSGSITVASATNPDGALSELTVEQIGGTASGVTLGSLAISNGSVTATFTAAAGTTSGTVVLRVVNAYGSSASVALNIVVGPALAFTSEDAAIFTLGTSSSFSITTNSQPAATISLTSGSLPAGVTFDPATGVLSGTPAAGTAGSYPLVFSASGSSGAATQNFTLTVRELRIYLPITIKP